MANVLTQNPIRIDTAMGSSWKTQVKSVLGSFYDLRVEKLYWENPNASGDTVSIEDNQANNLAHLHCENANQAVLIDWTAKPKRWADFTVNQISSGVLWIYIT